MALSATGPAAADGDQHRGGIMGLRRQRGRSSSLQLAGNQGSRRPSGLLRRASSDGHARPGLSDSAAACTPKEMRRRRRASLQLKLETDEVEAVVESGLNELARLAAAGEGNTSATESDVLDAHQTQLVAAEALRQSRRKISL